MHEEVFLCVLLLLNVLLSTIFFLSWAFYRLIWAFKSVIFYFMSTIFLFWGTFVFSIFDDSVFILALNILDWLLVVYYLKTSVRLSIDCCFLFLKKGFVSVYMFSKVLFLFRLQLDLFLKLTESCLVFKFSFSFIALTPANIRVGVLGLILFWNQKFLSSYSKETNLAGPSWVYRHLLSLANSCDYSFKTEILSLERK